jgi:hypothetical protein
MSGRRPSPRRQRLVSSPKRGRILDAVAQEAIDRCAWVIARCGYSPEESARRFQWTCEHIPTSVIRKGRAADPRYDLSAHILTLWSQDPNYLMPNGDLRPLRVRGPAPSIESLVRTLGGGLTIESAMKSLTSSQSLRRSGTKYIPRDSWVVAYPTNSLSQYAHHMRVFVDFLRTLEHNTRARSRSERWFQFAADNAFVPVSQIAALSRYLRKAGMTFLKDKDAMMHRMARRGKPRESTLPVSIGLYLSRPPSPKPRRVPRTRTK